MKACLVFVVYPVVIIHLLNLYNIELILALQYCKKRKKLCMHLQCTSLVQMIWVLIIAGGQGSKSYKKERQIQVDLLDAIHPIYFHSKVSIKY